MRMEPDAFLALLDQNLDFIDQEPLGSNWVAYHPVAGVFVGFQGERQLWSRVSPVVADSVVVFSEAATGITYLSEALDRHGFGSDALEMYQVENGNWASLLAVGLPVEVHVFEAAAVRTATHATTAMAQ
jgi:limonene-1,2-epoxide hydrolase